MGFISQLLREYGNMKEIEVTIRSVNQDGKESVSSKKLSTDGKLTINHVIAMRGLQKAMSGDFHFWKEVLNRTEGRVPQPIDLGGQSDNPIVFNDLSKLSTDELIRRRDALRRRIADEANRDPTV